MPTTRTRAATRRKKYLRNACATKKKIRKYDQTIGPTLETRVTIGVASVTNGTSAISPVVAGVTLSIDGAVASRILTGLLTALQVIRTVIITKALVRLAAVIGIAHESVRTVAHSSVVADTAQSIAPTPLRKTRVLTGPFNARPVVRAF